MATTTTKLKMKLLIDTKKNRVLFAEANKDVVDFLFSLLDLPVGTIVDMLGSKYMCGSVGNLYASVWDLDYDYIHPSADKIDLLRPKVVPSPASTSRSSPLLLAPSDRQRFFRCTFSDHCDNYVTNKSTTNCPSCHRKMTREVEYVDGSGGNVQKASSSKGFVQAAVTYTVRDDLTVTPMSNISSITLFSTLRVTDFSALREKTVWLGYNEGLQILKASLQSKTVLTDVFLSMSSRVRFEA
ncbi:hypothetical protein BDA96_03G070100 [Sorghum bicolor]|uniref:DUF674 domain-containing protein n=2 Tax=Sorghum bicolor TaxID=4558 RepID=A0A921RCI4_SORBI|nr:uncharacterized protein LOC8059133 [Sorghum bicolor]EES02446.1 hypothetical protein SORBI_3003G066500 [Sorghum bicolor]KAG0536512.1 hypothetical protein BDA96_03G070100 [Sorghum bicolor]|eukprot:XP_002457326.1 uncharacterized protein LOC8059133 [Sorghum bicolor]